MRAIMRSVVALPMIFAFWLAQEVTALPAPRAGPSHLPFGHPAAPRATSAQDARSMEQCTPPQALRLRGGNNKEPAPLKQAPQASWKSGWRRTALVAGSAGAIAGLSVDFLLWPVEKVKTRIQAGEPSGFNLATPIETITRLFEGCHVSLVFGPIFWGLFFAVYEPAKEALLARFGEAYKNTVFLTATTLAVWLSFVIRVPVEIVKTRMMTGADHKMSLMKSFARIVEKEGLLGLYSGFWSLSLRELPFSVIEMSIYENVRAMWTQHTGRTTDASISMLENCMIGSIVDGMTAWATNPFDVIKSRLMNQVGETGQHSMLSVLRNVLAERGLVGLMDGASVRLLWMAIGGFIFWPVFEGSQNVLNAILGPAQK